jgi:GT2 family glycosyltransferase
MKNLAIIILNYNTNEMTKNLADFLNYKDGYKRKRIFVIDNASNPPYVGADFRLETNVGFTNGMFAGYEFAKWQNNYWAYLFLNSDVNFGGNTTIIESMMAVLSIDKSHGQISPAHNSPYGHMYDKPEGYGEVNFLEPTATMVKASTIENVGFWDRDLTMGYGVDFDYGYRIRQAGLKNVVDYDSKVIHLEHRSITNISEYANKAWGECNEVLIKKYGNNWRQVLSC